MALLLAASEQSELAGRAPHIRRSLSGGAAGGSSPLYASCTAAAYVQWGAHGGAALNLLLARPPLERLATPTAYGEALRRAYDPAQLRVIMADWLASLTGCTQPGTDVHWARVGEWGRRVGAQSVRHANGGREHALAEWIFPHLVATLGAPALPLHHNATRGPEATPALQTRTQLRHAELLALCDGLAKAGIGQRELARRLAWPQRDPNHQQPPPPPTRPIPRTLPGPSTPTCPFAGARGRRATPPRSG